MTNTTAWAQVLVNRAVSDSSALRSQVKVRVRVQDGPEGDLGGWVKGHQAALMTHGMWVPVHCDPVTRAPVQLMENGLDEAIGRYYQQRDPEKYATWEEALKDRRRIRTRDQFVPYVGIKDTLSAAKEAPGFIRGMFREARKAAKEVREPATGGRPAARVTGMYELGDGLYELQLLVMDSPNGRPVSVRAPLSEARVQHLQRIPWLEVTVDPADPDTVTL